MGEQRLKIGVVAPGSRLEPAMADKVRAIAETTFGARAPEIHFHPQCFLSWGHFAGTDEQRRDALIEIANDESYGALWFARGGYGACRLVEKLLPKLTPAARKKTYLGYSDAGTLLAALYQQGCTSVAHGPMVADIKREGGEAALVRALRFLVERDSASLEATVAPERKSAAFNMTILSMLLGTPWQPNLSDHVLMLEEVSEHMYRIDRTLCHIISNPSMRRVAGIRLGRCSLIPPNDPDFGQDEEQVVKHWCEVSDIPYLGRADIGHDVENKVVPFGSAPRIA